MRAVFTRGWSHRPLKQIQRGFQIVQLNFELLEDVAGCVAKLTDASPIEQITGARCSMIFVMSCQVAAPSSMIFQQKSLSCGCRVRVLFWATVSGENSQYFETHTVYSVAHDIRWSSYRTVSATISLYPRLLHWSVVMLKLNKVFNTTHAPLVSDIVRLLDLRTD